jgi:hypothetical protein
MVMPVVFVLVEKLPLRPDDLVRNPFDAALFSACTVWEWPGSFREFAWVWFTNSLDV